MNVLLSSALPESAGFLGMRHHYPALVLSPGTDGGLSFAQFTPGGPFPFSGGATVAHLTGTSLTILRAAEELESRGVPYLYSPMIPSFPTALESLAGRIAAAAAVETGQAREAALAARIAGPAFRVIARDTPERRYLNRKAGIPLAKCAILRGPVLPAKALRRGGGAGGPEAAPEPGNLAIAFCDEIAPEWNVMRLLSAMEKINADAVIVSGRSDTPYSRGCGSRAGINPRVRLVFFDPGNPAASAAEIPGIAARASILVDPSSRGLCGLLAAAAADGGVPSVVSRRSAGASRPAAGLFTFEPSSWELLNHAITSAFNMASRTAAGPAGKGVDGDATGGAAGNERTTADEGTTTGGGTAANEETAGDRGEARNAEIKRFLREAYEEAAGRSGR